MNAPDRQPNDTFSGVYTRSIGNAVECWRVSLSERAFMYRIEHRRDDGSIDIDTVVDQDNLEAKLQKWHREGYLSDAEREKESVPGAAADFMADLHRIRSVGAASAQSHSPSRPPSRSPSRSGGSARRTVSIGDVAVPVGAANPLVPALNPAYLFSERIKDVIEDIVENRRVMLIGHTGSGKTSLIEQIAARSKHGVLRSNMNGQTTIGDFVGFWTVKGGETVWVDGVLPSAMRDGRWLIIDEIDFAEPAILAVLTAVLEPGGKLLLKEKGNDIIAPHPSFRLFATANAVGAMSQFRHLYQGANLMNEAFLDRWRVHLIDYLAPEEEAHVLMQTLAPNFTASMARTLASIAAECRAAFAREDLASAFSTRRLLDWAQLIVRTGDPERAAGPSIYAKVSPQDAALIRSILRHHIALEP